MDSLTHLLSWNLTNEHGLLRYMRELITNAEEVDLPWNPATEHAEMHLSMTERVGQKCKVTT